MWRYLVGGLAGVLAIVAGMVLQATRPGAPQPLLAATVPAAQASGVPAAEPEVPEALERTREQKRFDRYDKDRNGTILREEYLAPRRKAFAKLDRNGDGVLSFDEWAVKAETKFDTADKDKSGSLTRDEFATTAVKRKPKPRCTCGAQPAVPAVAESVPDES